MKAMTPTPSSGATRNCEVKPDKMFWCSMTRCPPASVSFHASATVHPVGSVRIESVSKKLASPLPQERAPAARATSCPRQLHDLWSECLRAGHDETGRRAGARAGLLNREAASLPDPRSAGGVLVFGQDAQLVASDSVGSSSTLTPSKRTGRREENAFSAARAACSITPTSADGAVSARPWVRVVNGA